jgi:hypothetical protein
MERAPADICVGDGNERPFLNAEVFAKIAQTRAPKIVPPRKTGSVRRRRTSVRRQ